MKSIDDMTPEEAANLSLEDVARLGSQHVCVSLALTMYFKQPLATFPDAVAQVIEAYLAHAEPHLRWYADWEDTKFRQATPERLRLPVQLLHHPKYQAQKDFGWIYVGSEHFDDLAPWQLHGVSQGASCARWLSWLQLTFPPDYWSSNYPAFAQWIGKVVELVPVFHGHAGFAFSQHQDPGAEQAASEYIYPLAMRFHGIEVDATDLTARSCYKSIKGVNWFTLVNAALLDELGGPNMTAAALEREGGITVHRMPWGLCIQAGDEPGIGDVNENPKPLPLYRKVNKVLRWIRTSTHFPLGDDEYHKSFGDIGTLKWLRRFDDPAGDT